MKFNRFAKFIVILSFLFLGNISYADNVQDALNKYEEGVEYYAQGQYEQAVSSFKRATELNPDYIDAYFNLGSLLEYLKKEREALEAFKQIVLRKPDDYEAVYKAAELSKKLGDLDKARMYVSLIPQDSDFGLQAKELAQSIKISSPAQTKVSQPASVSSSSASSSTASSSSSAVSSSKEDIPRSTYQTYQKESPISHSNGSYDNIPSPTGIAADSLGNLYVAGFSDNVIYKITPDNKKIVFLKDSKIDGPIGIAIDPQRNIYIANYNKDNVLKVSSSGEVSEFITNVSNPYCMFISDGLLFVSSQGDNMVIRRKLR